MQEEVETSMYDAVAGMTKGLKRILLTHLMPILSVEGKNLVILDCRIRLSREYLCRRRRRNKYILFSWSP